MTMNLVLEIFQSLFILLAVLVAFYLIGRLLIQHNYFQMKSISIIFLRMFIGLISFVCAYSIFHTNGRTFNIFLLLIIAIFLLHRKNRGEQIHVQFSTVVVGISLSLLFFCVQVLSFVNLSSHFPNIPHNDILFYLTVSDFLPITGEENIYSFRNFIEPSLNGLSPYHYFELWLSAGISNLVNGQSYQIFQLVTSTSLLVIAAFGVISLFAEMGLNSLYIQFAGGFLALFYCGFSVDVKSLHLIPINGVILIKFLPTYIFLAAALLLLCKDRHIDCFVVLLGLGAINTSAYPGVVIGIVLFVLVSGFFKILRTPDIIKSTAIVFIFIICFVLWFSLFKSRSNILTADVVQFNSLHSALKTWLSQSANIVINHLVTFVTLAFLIRKKSIWDNKSYSIVLILLFIVFGGLLFSGVTQSVASSQFSYGLYLPALMILTLLTLSKLKMTGSVRTYRVFLFVITVFGIWSFAATLGDGRFRKTARIENYSKEYLEKVNSLVKDDSIVLGLFVANSSTFKGNHLSKAEDYSYPGKYLKVLKSRVYMVNYYSDRIASDSAVLMSEFNRRNNLMTLLSSHRSGYSKFDFVNEFRPQFLIISSNDSFPIELRFFYSDSIKDHKSGERFYSLKYGD